MRLRILRTSIEVGTIVIVGLFIYVCISLSNYDCVQYKVFMTEQGYQGHPGTELQSVQIYFGPEGGRLDAGNTTYIVQQKKAKILFHEREEFWNLPYPFELEALASEEEASRLEGVRELATATIDMKAPNETEEDSGGYFFFDIRQGRIGMDQSLDIWIDENKPKYVESFWKVVDVAAELSVLSREWFKQLPAFAGIPSRIVVTSWHAWNPRGSEVIEMTASSCESRPRSSVFAVGEDYKEIPFDLSAILTISDGRTSAEGPLSSGLNDYKE